MGQNTCDRCSEIPKIISTNLETKKILFKFKEHGHIERNIRDYLLNALNYSTKNWKCSDCDTIQRKVQENFTYCESGSVFCKSCYGVNKTKFKIQRDKII